MTDYTGCFIVEGDKGSNDEWYLLNDCDSWTCNFDPVKIVRTLDDAKKYIIKYPEAAIMYLDMEVRRGYQIKAKDL